MVRHDKEHTKTSRARKATARRSKNKRVSNGNPGIELATVLRMEGHELFEGVDPRHSADMSANSRCLCMSRYLDLCLPTRTSLAIFILPSKVCTLRMDHRRLLRCLNMTQETNKLYKLYDHLTAECKVDKLSTGKGKLKKRPR